LTNQVSRFALELTTFGMRAENYFETRVGNFWDLVETRAYCLARHNLANQISYFNHLHELRSVYNVVLSHQLELLRLSSNDNQGIRDDACFTLINLNRDKDSYNFIKWWAKGESYSSKPSVEGTWLYYTDQDPTEDFLSILTSSSHPSLSHLVAVLLIKFRLWAKYEALDRQKKKHENRVLKVDLEAQLMGLYEIIKSKNTYMLPGICDPGALRKLGASNSQNIRGGAGEALVVLKTTP
jgi:hypothetical protein